MKGIGIGIFVGLIMGIIGTLFLVGNIKDGMRHVEIVKDGCIVEKELYYNERYFYERKGLEKTAVRSAGIEYFSTMINEKYGDTTDVHIDILVKLEHEYEVRAITKCSSARTLITKGTP